jgi:hypothetical protein
MTEKKKARKKPVKKALKAPAKKNFRDRINVLALIEALEQHVLGEKEMTATQVSAALALLKKTLPDMVDPLRKGAAKSGHEDALKELE